MQRTCSASAAQALRDEVQVQRKRRASAASCVVTRGCGCISLLCVSVAQLKLCTDSATTRVQQSAASTPRAAPTRALRECSFNSSAAPVLRECSFSSSPARQLQLGLALRKFGRDPDSLQGQRDRECSAKAAHVQGSARAPQAQRVCSACAARVQCRYSARTATSAAHVQRECLASASAHVSAHCGACARPVRGHYKCSASAMQAQRVCSARAARVQRTYSASASQVPQRACSASGA